MANIPKSFVRKNLTTTNTNATVPALKRWIITNIVLTNTGTATQTATVTLDGITLLSAVQIEAGGTFTLDCKQVLDAGKNLGTLANATTVACHVSGVEADV